MLAPTWQPRCHPVSVTHTSKPGTGKPDDPKPLPPDDLAPRLYEVFAVLGPLYRRVSRKVELNEPIEGLSIGVRAVLDLLRAQGPLTVPQMGRAQALSRQFVQRMVNEVAAHGLVEAVANPAHQRSSLIRLTPPGSYGHRRGDHPRERAAEAGGRRPHRRGRGEVRTGADAHAGGLRGRGRQLTACTRRAAQRRLPSPPSVLNWSHSTSRSSGSSRSMPSWCWACRRR